MHPMLRSLALGHFLKGQVIEWTSDRGIAQRNVGLPRSLSLAEA